MRAKIRVVRTHSLDNYQRQGQVLGSYWEVREGNQSSRRQGSRPHGDHNLLA